MVLGQLSLPTGDSWETSGVWIAKSNRSLKTLDNI